MLQIDRQLSAHSKIAEAARSAAVEIKGRFGKRGRVNLPKCKACDRSVVFRFIRNVFGYKALDAIAGVHSQGPV